MIRIESTDPAVPAPLPAHAPLDLEQRFDSTGVWASLPPEHQAEVGAAVLALLAAWAAIDAAELEDRMLQSALHRAASQAENLAVDVLVHLFDTVVPGFQAKTAAGQPRLPDTIGMVCRRCGCSELDACAGGCGWAGPSLCTACADAEEGGLVSSPSDVADPATC